MDFGADALDWLPSVRTNVPVESRVFPLPSGRFTTVAVSPISRIPSSARVSSSWAREAPAPSRSRHTRSSPNTAAAASIRPSPFRSSTRNPSSP